MKFSVRWLVVAMLSLSACGATPDVSKVATEQAALKQRVQTLEARVKKLEGKGGKAGKSKAPAKAKAKVDPAKAKAAKSKSPAPAAPPAPAK